LLLIEQQAPRWRVRSFWLCWAEALGKANQPEEGLKLIEEGLALVQGKGERCYLAELNRIKGELVLIQAVSRRRSRADITGDAAADVRATVSQAETCFHQSIMVARQQKAKSWELRAAMSIARLYQKQNKQKEGRDLLAEIYNRFTEGFDTMDLRETKVLLDELSRQTQWKASSYFD
jgi:predicted ATPase